MTQFRAYLCEVHSHLRLRHAALHHFPGPSSPTLAPPQKRQAAQRAAEEQAAARQAAAPPPPALQQPASPRQPRSARAAAAPGAYARYFDEGPGGDAAWDGLGSGQAAGAAGQLPPASPQPRSLDQLPVPLPLSPEGQRAFKAQVGLKEGGAMLSLSSAAAHRGCCCGGTPWRHRGMHPASCRWRSAPLRACAAPLPGTLPTNPHRPQPFTLAVQARAAQVCGAARARVAPRGAGVAGGHDHLLRPEVSGGGSLFWLAWPGSISWFWLGWRRLEHCDDVGAAAGRPNGGGQEARPCVPATQRAQLPPSLSRPLASLLFLIPSFSAASTRWSVTIGRGLPSP